MHSPLQHLDHNETPTIFVQGFSQTCEKWDYFQALKEKLLTEHNRAVLLLADVSDVTPAMRGFSRSMHGTPIFEQLTVLASNASAATPHEKFRRYLSVCVRAFFRSVSRAVEARKLHSDRFRPDLDKFQSGKCLSLPDLPSYHIQQVASQLQISCCAASS